MLFSVQINLTNLTLCTMLLHFLLKIFFFAFFNREFALFGGENPLRLMKSNYPMNIDIFWKNFFDKISSFCEYIKFIGVIWTRRYAFGVFIRNFALFGGENHLRPMKLNFPMKIYTLGKNFFYKNILFLWVPLKFICCFRVL